MCDLYADSSNVGQGTPCNIKQRANVVKNLNDYVIINNIGTVYDFPAMSTEGWMTPIFRDDRTSINKDTVLYDNQKNQAKKSSCDNLGIDGIPMGLSDSHPETQVCAYKKKDLYNARSPESIKVLFNCYLYPDECELKNSSTNVQINVDDLVDVMNKYCFDPVFDEFNNDSDYSGTHVSGLEYAPRILRSKTAGNGGSCGICSEYARITKLDTDKDVTIQRKDTLLNHPNNPSKYMRKMCDKSPNMPWCDCIEQQSVKAATFIDSDLKELFNASKDFPQCWYQPCRDMSTNFIPIEYADTSAKSCPADTCSQIVNLNNSKVNDTELIAKINCPFSVTNNTPINPNPDPKPNPTPKPNPKPNPDTPSDSPKSMSSVEILGIVIVGGGVACAVIYGAYHLMKSKK